MSQGYATFVTALPSLFLHNFSCCYCLTENGCTQGKVSTTYISQNALDDRSEIPSRPVASDHSVFSISKCYLVGLLNSCFCHARGSALCSQEGGTLMSNLCIKFFKVINRFGNLCCLKTSSVNFVFNQRSR